MFSKANFTKEIAEAIMTTFETINNKLLELEKRIKKLEEEKDE